MTTDTKQSILDQIRALKEENAAEHGYSLEEIIASARGRQEASGRRIIRQSKKEEDTDGPGSSTSPPDSA